MSIKSPFTTKVEKGAYSAIVYLDGDLCVAEDNVGTVISEQAKSDYVSDVIQAAADEIGQGAIFLKNEAEEYIIKSGVSWVGGISFVSDGAALNLEALNDTFLSIGSDDVTSEGEITLVSGLSVIGDHTNANTLFLKASRILRGLVVSDVCHKGVANGIEVRGISYSTVIERVTGGWISGDWIKLVAFAEYGQAPNATIIANCEAGNGYHQTGNGTGIKILSSAEFYPQKITIMDTWIEALSTGIYTEGANVNIKNNLIECEDYGVYLHKHATGSYAKDSIIMENIIKTNEATGIGIALLGNAWCNHTITNNKFVTTGVGIQNGKHNYASINNNLFLLGAANAIGIGQTGTDYVQSSTINSNFFYGAGTPQGTAISAYIKQSLIENNVFEGLLYWLNNTNISNCLIQGNNIISVTNAPTVASSSIIKNNKGYYTEKRGTSTGTGAQQTIAHGLSAAPTIVMVGNIEQNASPYQSAAADGTNIYITAGNGLDWWWNAEV